MIRGEGYGGRRRLEQLMQKRPFGSSGVEVPVIGQGTWHIESSPRQDVIAALRRGLDLGMTHIDTAEMYGRGEAETITGEAIRGRRNEVFLVSKVLPSNASKAGTIKACEASLKRLGTDYLDCYLLHWRGSYPLSDTFGAFEQLKAQGKIRSWGVSNFDVSDLEETKRLFPTGGPVCNQVLYNLWTRSIEHDVIPWCRENNIAVTGYTTFGQGQFPTPSSPAGAVLEELATAHDATPRQVVLAWAVREAPLFAIPKSSTVEHTEENAAAGDIVLTAEELAMLDLVFPRGPKQRRLPMG